MMISCFFFIGKFQVDDGDTRRSTMVKITRVGSKPKSVSDKNRDPKVGYKIWGCDFERIRYFWLSRYVCFFLN